MSDEQKIWAGTPSQVVNLGAFIICGLTFWLIVPIIIAFVKWLTIKFTNYEITTQRIRVTRGILSKRTDELELYRVQDTTFMQPFFLRLFSLANIVISTADISSPTVVLEAIPNAKELREDIRKNVEIARDKKRTRVLDVT